MAKKKHIAFFLMRVVIALFLMIILFLNLSSNAQLQETAVQLSTILRGDDSLLTVLRIIFSFVLLAITILLLLKKPAVISVGAFLATGLFAMLLVFCVVVMSMSFSAHVVTFVVIWSALLASVAVLFRFRGVLPVLGKFT
ncbi:MAG: hypothetical protein P8P36_04340 [Akkermansiaceae bacterium]|nr:hypothetical protein [Akkermansiaceae bacterium]